MLKGYWQAHAIELSRVIKYQAVYFVIRKRKLTTKILAGDRKQSIGEESQRGFMLIYGLTCIFSKYYFEIGIPKLCFGLTANDETTTAKGIVSVIQKPRKSGHGVTVPKSLPLARSIASLPP